VGGVETGVEKGRERGKRDGQKGASTSAFPAFFCLCQLGLAVQTRSLIFFPLIKPFLYTCFSGWAVLVVFDSPRAGAFNRVTGPTGRGERRKDILGSRLA
jgi:hypothetical protein